MQGDMCNALAKIFPLEPAMHCSSHFISSFKKKERKRKREALLLLAENPLEEKTSIVALLQASLHQEKDSSC
jgi:Na+-transporting methylmalonyl-CoA/oxaloacetate decarboxylase gamma subunit